MEKYRDWIGNITGGLVDSMIFLRNCIFCCHRNYNSRKMRKKSVIVILCLCGALFVINKYIQPVRFIFIHQNVNSTCLLPDINPFDKSVMKYIWHPKPIECDPTPAIVFIDSKGMLQINRTILHKSHNASFNCFYRLVKRSNGDEDVIFMSDVKFKHPVYIPADSVNVRCYSKNALVYDSILYNVDYRTTMKYKEVKREGEDTLSVLIFGMDSVSRLAAERKLTKTMKFIKHQLNGYVFRGYTSVAAITYPNVIASLTGKKAFSSELPNIDPRTEFTDSYPFIWNNFSDKGYVTMFSEDFPEIAIFNYMMKGFKDPPVDHYLRPYYIARKTLHPVQSNLDQVFMFLEDKSINFKQYSSMCYRDKPKHVVHIDHFKQFVSSYSNYRKFAFSWLTEIGHDYMNFLELADEDILNMIRSFHDEGFLSKSVLVFLSDHGPRTDEIRNTAVGRIEERMPLLSIVLPNHIRHEYPHLEENLRQNENRLTTAFDLYETYSDILNSNFKMSDEQYHRPYSRGISLFKKIPKDRTCSDASIAEHVCACYTATNASVSSFYMKAVATFVVQAINEQLANFKSKCSTLSLYKIRDAQKIKTGLQNKVEYNRKTLLNLFIKPELDTEQRYLVLIETVPGHALFEATVSDTPNNNFVLLGDVSRTNRYNNQSHCVSYKHLKPICFCKD